ncbi:MAG TPA: zinc ribbon domain-containing protein [Thermoanaerobaculia bacterium]|nr:zinc ribbon domain-containing protein [Thermoanaerobaculia bacterium]
MTTEIQCPECQSSRPDPSVVCPMCGAPPLRADDQRNVEEEVRSQDLEPYITLRYIAFLFKILAVIMVIMLIAEIVAGLTADAAEALPTLIGEITQLVVLAGLMWGGGDLTLLLIDAGHDLRVVRILLGRVNAELHRKGQDKV